MFVGNDFFRTDPMAGAVGNVFWEFSATTRLGLYRRASLVRGRLFASFDSLLLTMKHCYRSSTPTVVVFEEAPVFAPYNGSTRTFTPWTFPLFWGILLLHFTITNGESRMTQRTSATGIFLKTQGDFPPIMWVMDVHCTYTTCSLCLVSF